MVTPASFRQQFPAFTDPEVYSDTTIGVWVTLAGVMLDATRWDTLLDYGTSLFAAHHLALAARDALTAAMGGIPGAPQGVLTAKAVDKASSSYDTASITLENGGHWNQTRYGIEFLGMARMIGSGGMQITGCMPSVDANAWYGLF